MVLLTEFSSGPEPCHYLPGLEATTEYRFALTVTPAEYQAEMAGGWRRFGHLLFRPACAACRACQSLRVQVPQFTPSRSQRRAGRDNADLRLEIGPPGLSEAKLDLYDRYHAFQAGNVGWRDHGPKDVTDYLNSFVENPFPTEEWCYYRGEELAAVGYVDVLPDSLSAIYFFHDPALRPRGPGTFNVLCVLAEAARRGLPYVYLGYYVPGCRSLAYKAHFRPHELLGPDGPWRPGG